ncbi:MAG: xanthine dehydrogenase family protein subunit M [Thermodesulfobacteriota bacterium]
MRSFKHIDARTVDEACSLLRKYKGKSILNAGGTEVLSILKGECLSSYPEAVINIKTLSDLDYIKEEGGMLKIGALTKLSDIVKSPLLKSRCKALVEAAHSVATPQIRNMATLGGNLCQDVRCWYYRYPFQIGGRIECLRKGGKLCNALTGDHRYHSIFGAANRCLAVNPSDTAPALVALNAKTKTTKRRVDAQDFFAASATAPTILDPDELLAEIQIPRPPAKARQSYLKFTLRDPIDFAIVSVASVITVESGTCTDARIVLGAVAPTPVRASKAEEMIKGKPIDQNAAAEAAEQAVADATPLDMNAYKVEIAKSLVKRAILD